MTASHRYKCLGVCQGEIIVEDRLGTVFGASFQYNAGGTLASSGLENSYETVDAAIEAVLGKNWKGHIHRVHAASAFPIRRTFKRYLPCRLTKDGKAVVAEIHGHVTGSQDERFRFQAGGFITERFLTAVHETPEAALKAQREQALREIEELEKKKRKLLEEASRVSQALEDLDGVELVSCLFVGEDHGL